MVIACDRCNTRFHVDDSRVPATGVRVRCSRCKHAFFVVPGGGGQDAVHAAAEEAVVDPEPSAPGPSLDLEGPTAPRASEAEMVQDEEEEDWQFAVEPPSAAADRADESEDDSPFDMAAVRGEFSPDDSFSADSFEEVDDLRAERPQEPEPPRRHVEPERSSLEELDSPENWDFGAAEPAEPAATVPAPSEVSEVAAAAETAPAAPPARQVPELGDSRRPARPLRLAPSPRRASVLEAVLRSAGWLALLVLVGLGLYGALRSAPSRVPVPSRVSLGPLQAEEVSARSVENVRVGALTVVSASLQSAGDAPATSGVVLRVVPVDAAGSALPGAGVAGSEPSARRLREASPRELQDELLRSAEVLAWRPLPPGERLRVSAILDPPPEATHFVLETQPAPEPPAPAPEAGADSSEGEGAESEPSAPAEGPPAAEPS